MPNTPNTLFPTLSSTADAREFVMSMLPITGTNDAIVALNVYHNTLLDQVSQQAQGTYLISAKTLKDLESFRMPSVDYNEYDFGIQRRSYNQAIDHVLAYFKNRLGA